jgi:hypothetical protein
MKFTIKAEQLADQEVSELVLKMVIFGAKSEPGPGQVSYWISPMNEAIAEQYIPVALVKGIDIQEYNLWVKVADTITDNKVPADWPDATFTDPDDKEVTKRFDQYTIVRQGSNGESLLRIGHFPCLADEINKFNCVAAQISPEEIKRFIDYLASGDVTKVVYGSLFDAWMKDNTAPEG